MSEAPQTPSIVVEKTGQTLVARPQVKMLEDKELKALAQAIDQSAGADSGVSLVVVDLSQVKIVPSLALGLLVQILNKCKARHQKLKLAGLQPQIRQVFSITKLDKVFELATSVESAVE